MKKNVRGYRCVRIVRHRKILKIRVLSQEGRRIGEIEWRDLGDEWLWLEWLRRLRVRKRQLIGVDWDESSVGKRGPAALKTK